VVRRGDAGADKDRPGGGRFAAGQLADDFHPLDLAQRCLDDLASIDFCLRRSHGAVSGSTASERDERQKHQA